ncbi:MAG TPA: helix-turn-helix transcriptional regulator [Solirubrobacterales bacterium]|nr:helix-turn-helix transcriptional regulator [Solirubrobacterales bacterium]
MNQPRAYSPYAEDAAKLLGAQIRQGRHARRWSAEELAKRAGVSRPTLGKIERGDPSVGLGAAFEAARLVGVPLFGEGRDQLKTELARSRDRLALLPQRVRPSRRDVDDDF